MFDYEDYLEQFLNTCFFVFFFKILILTHLRLILYIVLLPSNNFKRISRWTNYLVPKTLFLDRYYFHRRVCVCLCVWVSVCLWVCISIISKSSGPILMKLGRMMYNNNISVPFKDEHNRFIRTEVTENPLFYFFLLRPFDNKFLMLLPLTSLFLLFERWNARL